MSDATWTALAETMTTRGLAAPGARPDSDPHAALARLNQRDSDSALEWLAGEFDIVPLCLARAACSTRAEEIFRRLARAKSSEEPWMPFGNLGPLLLCAHYSPAAQDFWGIADPFVIRALVSEKQYRELSDDIASRLALTPLTPDPDAPAVEPPPHGAGLLSMTQWFLRVYPLTEKEREGLMDAERAFQGNDYRRISDFKLLPKNHGVAFTHLSKGEM
ncbi:MAG: hypothetical protein ACREKL_00785, partial [Chthoniobacterales bacterium]